MYQPPGVALGQALRRERRLGQHDHQVRVRVIIQEREFQQVDGPADRTGAGEEGAAPDLLLEVRRHRGVDALRHLRGELLSALDTLDGCFHCCCLLVVSEASPTWGV